MSRNGGGPVRKEGSSIGGEEGEEGELGMRAVLGRRRREAFLQSSRPSSDVF